MGGGVIGLWLALARAQEAAQGSPPGDVEEIVVWGEAAVRQARSAVVRDLGAQGWAKVRERDGEVIFRPPQAWMGRMVLGYDGEVRFRSPVVALRRLGAANPVPYDENPHFDRDPGGLRYPSDAPGETDWALPHAEASLWILPGAGVRGRAQERVLAGIAPSLDGYRAVVARTRERDGG